MKSWLKGSIIGIICGIIISIIILLAQIIIKGEEIMYLYILWIPVIFLGFLLNLIKNSMIKNILGFVVLIIGYGIIGAIIDWIVQKIKSIKVKD